MFMEKKLKGSVIPFNVYGASMPSGGDLFLHRDAAEYLSLRDTE